MLLPQFYIRRLSTIVFVIIFALAVPLQVFAQADTTAPATVQPSNSTGRPTGIAAETYKLNESSGLWQNDHYTWDPVTQKSQAIVAPVYTYNAETNLYDTRIWEYVPATSLYVLTDVNVASPPEGAIKHGGPAIPADTTHVPVHALVSPSVAGADMSGTAITTNAPVGSTDELKTIKSDVSTTLNTVVNSSATSGDSLLQGNQNAGNATTGDALATATVINLLYSTSSLTGSGVAVFSTDIQGDLTGDLYIDPAAIMQPAGTTPAAINNIDVRLHTDGTIQNDINLEAVSGNASIIGNNTAGNATSGNATAIANVLNLINSVVAANQSFVGTVNIYGNFQGDILVPTDSLNALLASTGSAQSSPNASPETLLSLTDNQDIVNNIDLTAASGNAEATNNRHVGNVASGDALTRLTILNLTGKQVNAANSLLVFVNVLGTWVGLIMDAPAGTTAAAIGGGVTNNQSTGIEQAEPRHVSADSNASIINNITARAQSGSATAVDNTRVGDVKTGIAKASANIANFIGSQFNLSHWFGVLFINVFGSWHGNFGTARPLEAVAPGSTNGSDNGNNQTTDSHASQTPKLFSFGTTGSKKSGLGGLSPANFSSPAEYEEFVEEVNGVLAANNEVVQTIVSKSPPTNQDSQQSRFTLAALPLVLGFAGLSIVGTERIRSIRSKMNLHYYYRR